MTKAAYASQARYAATYLSHTVYTESSVASTAIQLPVITPEEKKDKVS